MIPDGLEWNQAELPSGPHLLKDCLVTLFAFSNSRSPRLIGTGFIVNASKSTAVAVTAAHNFEEVCNIQARSRRHHPTALPEFLGNLSLIDLDRKKLRISCMNRHGVEAAIVDWAAWDQAADVAFFGISTQDASKVYFDSHFRLEKPSIKVGDEVALLGYSDMKIIKDERDGRGFEEFSFSQQLLLRKGYITNYHPQGHILCKGPCVETSIPVFLGMSGGPVFVVPKEGEEMKPFGLISSCPETDRERKFDRSIRGCSIIALLDIKTEFESDDIQKTLLKLKQATLHKRDE